MFDYYSENYSSRISTSKSTEWNFCPSCRFQPVQTVLLVLRASSKLCSSISFGSAVSFESTSLVKRWWFWLRNTQNLNGSVILPLNASSTFRRTGRWFQPYNTCSFEYQTPQSCVGNSILSYQQRLQPLHLLLFRQPLPRAMFDTCVYNNDRSYMSYCI